MKINQARICLLLLSACGATAFATPIAYQIHFSSLGFPLPPESGSFTYDQTAPNGFGFSDFTVMFGGSLFDLTARANNPFVFTFDCGLTGSALGFALMGHSCNQQDEAIKAFWQAVASQGGTPEVPLYTFSFSGVFESPVILGVALVNRTPLIPDYEQGQWTITAIPEPSSLMLLFTSLLPVAILGRKHMAGRPLRPCRH